MDLFFVCVCVKGREEGRTGPILDRKDLVDRRCHVSANAAVKRLFTVNDSL